MKSLKDKEIAMSRSEINNKTIIDYYFNQKDVKEAVLEFDKVLEFEFKCLDSDPKLCFDYDSLKDLSKKFKEIFGDWEK